MLTVEVRGGRTQTVPGIKSRGARGAAYNSRILGMLTPSPLRFASSLLFALALLFVVNIFYPPAVVVTAPLKFLVCSWILAGDFNDYPLGLRGLGVRARLRWVGRHFGAFTGFGALWAVVCFVPGIALVLLPMGVAGATRLLLQDDPSGTKDNRE